MATLFTHTSVKGAPRLGRYHRSHSFDGNSQKEFWAQRRNENSDSPTKLQIERIPLRSSASFIMSIISIVIGILTFAIALTALILVLLLRSTIAANSKNSTISDSLNTNGFLPSACSNYTIINEPNRHVSAPGYALGCDNSAPFINRTSPIWIRFIGAGGTTLPLTTPGMNVCGSEGTGWYDGTMPSTAGMITNGTACFTWYNSVCRYSASISVANCGSFYIYKLPPAPACMARYCTI